ncbi:CAF17-like 4Fe-4S cluster assembly/insertion protein YgfZ [Pandoraea sputorum]|uniref:tRNA-modifying protein ygfZ n=1 Tax=Pandoraea sputorum TaxID=93222 RepID=A0A239SHJ8_9BURK|nr:folate-binding protein YgfZ [Pandoraea sputorum]AJC16931.1 folate-binding protein [Pandoraea sputorum]SNU84662.1 tRNA-modifying protein ygfZ [Pandoraea sputorum]VVD78591.1 folate-binding protein [Pandoraea sputorum]
MTSTWRDLLPQAAAASPSDISSDARAAQFDALRTGSFVALASDTGLIAVNGADAATFLHGQLTSDVERLSPVQARLAGYCSAKGRLLATFLMWRDTSPDATIYLASDATVQAAVQKRLSMFVLRAKAKLTDGTATHVLLQVGGPAVEAVLSRTFASLPAAALAAAHATMGDAPGNGTSLIRLPDAGTARSLSRFLWSVPVAQAAAVWNSLVGTDGVVAVDPTLAAWLDVQSGVARVTTATQEQFVPQMINWEVVGGVNFRKGCYPGQEVVARSQYRGTIKRRLHLAHVDGVLPAPGQELVETSDAEQPCGMVVLAAPAPSGGYDVLVELKLTAREADDVRLGKVDGPALVFGELPYEIIDPTEAPASSAPSAAAS